MKNIDKWDFWFFASIDRTHIVFHQHQVNDGTSDSSVIIDGPAVFSSWDQMHGNTFYPAKRWNGEEAQRAHADRRIRRGTDCRNQLGIAVITVAAVVVYIK